MKTSNFFWRKVLVIVLIGFGLLYFSRSVLAGNPVVVRGTVTDKDGHPAPLVQIVVACRHGLTTTTRTTTTDENGDYSVTFGNDPDIQCDQGDHVTVTGLKGNVSGATDGQIPPNRNLRLDFVVTKSQNVPEFGLITGIFTLIASAGAFRRLKKKST